jgi:hypothetical protein
MSLGLRPLIKNVNITNANFYSIDMGDEEIILPKNEGEVLRLIQFSNIFSFEMGRILKRFETRIINSNYNKLIHKNYNLNC